jgi:hypothetical protein
MQPCTNVLSHTRRFSLLCLPVLLLALSASEHFAASAAKPQPTCNVTDLALWNVSEQPIDGFPAAQGKVRPGKMFYVQFTGPTQCTSLPDVQININPAHVPGHGIESAEPMQGTYNALFAVRNPYIAPCDAQGGCALALTAPLQIGSFRADIQVGTRAFPGIPLEVTCSDHIFCNGEEKFVRGQCQVPYAASVVAPCGQDVHTGSAVGGCPAGSCTCFPCDETKQACSQFPQAAFEAGNQTVSSTQTDVLIENYIAACGKGDARNYCAYACTPDCGTKQKPRECGADGCGGSCGPLDGFCPMSPPGTPALACNAAGQCVESSGALGTCANPIPLFASENFMTPSGVTDIAPPKFALVPGFRTLQELTAGYPPSSALPVVVPTTGIEMTIFGDNADGEDEVQPSCNSPGVPEKIYTFVISPTIFPLLPEAERAQGFEAVMLDAFGRPVAVDTLLAIHGGPGATNDCRKTYDNGIPADQVCSDDATPPGGVGSHVYAALKPGTYYLVATSYAAQAAAPYRMIIKFTDASGQLGGNESVCRANQCVNRACGVDGCRYAFAVDAEGMPQFVDAVTDLHYSGTCGYQTCEAGLVCSESSGQCQAADCPMDVNDPTYPFDCQNRQCGFDGGNCGHSCGQCAANKACNFDTNQCVPVKMCDSNAPECPSNKQGTGAEEYCGYDCQWHKTYEPLVDLIPNGEGEITPTIVFQTYELPASAEASSCTLREGCLLNPADYPGLGTTHYLMRFTTNVHNIGPVGFVPGSPKKRPDLFEFSDCHGHFHFDGFAKFDLYDALQYVEGDFVPFVKGGKLSYCMEDTLQYQFSPQVGCQGVSSCDSQGIQAGWTDKYPADLDCQWVDVTLQVKADDPRSNPLLDQWYMYEVCANTARKFAEASFDNNCTRFLVYLPRAMKTGNVSYASYMAEETNRKAACGSKQLAQILATGQFTRPCICDHSCTTPVTFEQFLEKGAE